MSFKQKTRFFIENIVNLVQKHNIFEKQKRKIKNINYILKKYSQKDFFVKVQKFYSKCLQRAQKVKN